MGLFHKSIVFYDTKKLVYFTIKSFPENDRKKCCTNLARSWPDGRVVVTFRMLVFHFVVDSRTDYELTRFINEYT